MISALASGSLACLPWRGVRIGAVSLRRSPDYSLGGSLMMLLSLFSGGVLFT
jgi:hypothetical protein